MDVAHIHELFREGRFSFFFHAFQEALKDGITGDDISYVIEHVRPLRNTLTGNGV